MIEGEALLPLKQTVYKKLTILMLFLLNFLFHDDRSSYLLAQSYRLCKLTYRISTFLEMFLASTISQRSPNAFLEWCICYLWCSEKRFVNIQYSCVTIIISTLPLPNFAVSKSLKMVCVSQKEK